MYIIKRSDGAYVSRPGSTSSYTRRIEEAQKFMSREEAEQNRCPGNEYVLSVDSILRK